MDTNVSLINKMEKEFSLKRFNIRLLNNFEELEEKPSSQYNKSNIFDKNTSAHSTRKIPDAIIIGVKKCGTCALLEYLRLNPNIKAAGPEPYFFDRYNYHLGLGWYR
jgi:hypothetical protein